MLLSIDSSNLIPRLMSAANRALRAARLDGDDRSLKRSWVRQWLRRQEDLDWDSESVLAEMETSIGEDAIALFRKRGYEPRPARRDSEMKLLAPTSVGRAYATATRVRHLAEDARLVTWGKPSPPFRFTKTGADEAREWFKEQDLRIREAGLDTYPAMWKLELVLEDPGVREWDSQLESAEGSELSTAVVELLNAHPKSLRFVRHEGGYDGAYLPFLEVTQANGLPRRYLAPRTSVLGRLRSRITRIVEEAGWWSQREATDFVVFGQVPSGSVRISTKRTGAPHGEPQEIVLTVCAPTTRDEVAKAFDQVLRENGLRPAKLSAVHNAVLQLVYATPDLTWRERYNRWLEWCKQHPYLPDFKGDTTSGPPALHTTYRRALKRIQWKPDS